jgi:YggT family protein
MSWLINFQILNLRQPLVASIWDGLNRLLEPVYSRIRSFLPQMGGLDLAPLIAFVAVIAIEIVLRNNAMAFY